MSYCVLCISSQLCVQWHPFSNVKSGEQETQDTPSPPFLRLLMYKKDERPKEVKKSWYVLNIHLEQKYILINKIIYYDSAIHKIILNFN